MCIDEVDLLRGVQRMLKRAIPWTVEEGFEVAATFASQPLPRGNRVVVVTTAGGWGVVTADALAGTDHDTRRRARARVWACSSA